MNLAALQGEFMGHVLEDERPLPPSWRKRMAAGLDVYRNAYRARLVEALRETFPCTARWAGEEPFRAAAAHYLIGQPPRGWTLDRVGEGFVETLEELFVNDPDVADLAWLEWAMHCAFTAADDPPLDLGGFADRVAQFGEADWAELRLQLVPSLRLRRVRTNCAALWRSLQGEAAPDTETPLEAPSFCIAWREGLAPVFRLIDAEEGECLENLTGGASFGEICCHLADRHGETLAAERAGEMLRRWLSLGKITSLVSNRTLAPARVIACSRAAAQEPSSYHEPTGIVRSATRF